MINTKKEIYFYDDRAKTDTILKSKKVLFENDKICLCLAKIKKSKRDFFILFDIESGNTLSIDFESWYATNDKKFINSIAD